MSKELLISIITVNYNDAEGLEKTIKNVQSQTYRDFEHIIIDGDSTDGSKAIIEKYKSSFSYWVSEPDTGIYNAMNKGIRAAKGRFLYFLNTKDEFYNVEVLKEISNKLSINNDIYYGNLILKKSNNHKERVIYTPKELTFSFFLKRTIPHQAAFIKKSLFDSVFYYNEDFKIVSDWEFFMCAIIKQQVTYQYLDMIISYYDSTGISSNKLYASTFKKEKQISLRNHFGSIIDDYTELQQNRKLLKTNRFKMLLELEKSTIAKKANSFMLRIFLRIFRGKSLNLLDNE